MNVVERITAAVRRSEGGFPMPGQRTAGTLNHTKLTTGTPHRSLPHRQKAVRGVRPEGQVDVGQAEPQQLSRAQAASSVQTMTSPASASRLPDPYDPGLLPVEVMTTVLISE